MELSQGRAVTFKSGDGLTLEGLLHLPAATPCPGLVVAHPHPQYGGDMYNNVVHAVCRAAMEAGAAALRFNFRGVGASEGAFDGAAEQFDVAGAVDHLRGLPEVQSSRVAVAGYSFGALMVLRFADRRQDLRAILAVSPPTQGAPGLELSLTAPALFVAGDRDGYCDVTVLNQHREGLGEAATVVVHPGVDHFWWGSDDRLIGTVADFLRARL